MSRTARYVLVAAFVVAAAVAFVLARPGGERGPVATTTSRAQSPPTRPQPPPVPLIRVVEGRPVGGPLEIEVRRGETIRFRVVSDARADVHVHGYDLTRELPAGREVAFSFPARLEGIFEVELHPSDSGIAALRVTP